VGFTLLLSFIELRFLHFLASIFLFISREVISENNKLMRIYLMMQSGGLYSDSGWLGQISYVRNRIRSEQVGLNQVI
jgi:hypothetical protein